MFSVKATAPADPLKARPQDLNVAVTHRLEEVGRRHFQVNVFGEWLLIRNRPASTSQR